jgi:hypothetical protein
MPHEYKKPGRYVAICNKTIWDGHYIKIFDFPEPCKEDFTCYPLAFIAEGDVVIQRGDETKTSVSASWYFLNRVDGVACLEAVYPMEIFRAIKDFHWTEDGPQCTEEYCRNKAIEGSNRCGQHQEHIGVVARSLSALDLRVH